MDEHLTDLDTALLSESLAYLQKKYDNTKYATYEDRQRQLQRVDDVRARFRAGQLSSIDKDLVLEALEDTRKNFATYEYYPSDEFKQSQLQRVNTLIAKMSAL